MPDVPEFEFADPNVKRMETRRHTVQGECEPCHSALRGLHFQPKGLYRECLVRDLVVIH